jgi:8-oxo-dGTP pyrophosphatase MutT (NUDIX family)
MPISPYLRSLRARIGTDLVLTPAVAAVIPDAEGHILVERRSDDPSLYSLPAGALDPGETPADALVREVFEETGLVVRPTRVLGVFGGRAFRVRYPNGDQVEYTVVLFSAETVGGALAPRDGEALDLRYVPPDALAALGLPYPPALLAEAAARTPPVFAYFDPPQAKDPIDTYVGGPEPKS